MSLDDLDKIRPDGVISKNDRGARKIPPTKEMCNARAAYQHPMRGARSAKTDPMAKNN